MNDKWTARGPGDTDAIAKANQVIQDAKKEYVVKDSGKREEYDSGMVRDTQEGKPDYTLIDRTFLKRWAAHMTLGAKKYGRDNWRKANSEAELTRFRASAFRHLVQWLEGESDEDHAAAVVFNLAAAESVREKLKSKQSSFLAEILREKEKMQQALHDDYIYGGNLTTSNTDITYNPGRRYR